MDKIQIPEYSIENHLQSVFIYIDSDPFPTLGRNQENHHMKQSASSPQSFDTLSLKFSQHYFNFLFTYSHPKDTFIVLDKGGTSGEKISE